MPPDSDLSSTTARHSLGSNPPLTIEESKEPKENADAEKLEANPDIMVVEKTAETGTVAYQPSPDCIQDEDMG